jgi:hypothetical protein
MPEDCKIGNRINQLLYDCAWVAGVNYIKRNKKTLKEGTIQSKRNVNATRCKRLKRQEQVGFLDLLENCHEAEKLFKMMIQ